MKCLLLINSSSGNADGVDGDKELIAALTKAYGIVQFTKKYIKPKTAST